MSARQQETRNEKPETSLLTSLTRSGLSGYRCIRNGFYRVLIEAVAEASNGADQAWIGGVGLNFLAQAQDVDLHCAVGHRAVVAPDCVQKLLAAIHHARAAHQKIQQAEFRGGQGNFGAMPQYAATGAIQLQGSRANGADRHGLATELVLDASDQLADEEWFDDIVVGAEFEAENPVSFRDFGGQKEDGNVGQLRMVA